MPTIAISMTSEQSEKLTRLFTENTALLQRISSLIDPDSIEVALAHNAAVCRTGLYVVLRFTLLKADSALISSLFTSSRLYNVTYVTDNGEFTLVTLECEAADIRSIYDDVKSRAASSYPADDASDAIQHVVVREVTLNVDGHSSTLSL